MRNFAEFTRKHLCQSLLFDKVKLCRSAASLKTRLQRRCFLANFAKFVRTPFLQNTTRRLLLIITVSTVFAEKASSQIFDWVENRLQGKGLKYGAHSCSQPSTYTEKILSRKMCDIVFENTKGIHAEASNHPKGSLKMVLREISQNLQENICAKISFLIKLNSVDLQLL